MDPEAREACEVMGRYCDGEAAAFQRLYVLLAPRVLAFLVGLLKDHAAAEDVLQLAFMKLHDARANYVRDANPIPWIYTIAHRTCLDELRRRKRSRVRLTGDGEMDRVPAAHFTGVAEDERQSEGDDEGGATEALAALQKLPDNQRQALILTKLHGRSVAEAAVITGSTPGAIKLRAHRAYVTLRKMLQKNAAGPAVQKRVA